METKNRMSFLRAEKVAVPKERYWEQEEFRVLALACGAGQAQAVEKMACFFMKMQEKNPGIPFYACAANFWNYRSWACGNKSAEPRWESARKNASGGQLSSPYLTERLESTYSGVSGEALNALGFLFFDAGRIYHLQGMDSSGVVTVFAFESEDPPDDDGFGRETYYDWWHLDSDLSPVPGTSCLHSYSGIDRNARSVSERFDKDYALARRGIIRKRERNLKEKSKF